MERLGSQKCGFNSYERLNSREFGRPNSQRWTGPGLVVGGLAAVSSSSSSSSSVQVLDCKSLLVGFLSGGFIMYLLLFAAKIPSVSLDVVQIQGTRFHIYGSNFSTQTTVASPVISVNNNAVDEAATSRAKVPAAAADDPDRLTETAKLLYSLWEDELLLFHAKNKSSRYMKNDKKSSDLGNLPKAPHIQDCDAEMKANKQFDTRTENGTRPRWTLWKRYLSLGILKASMHIDDSSEDLLLQNKTTLEGPYPPWVEGGDEDNLPFTRRVQRDLWLHQHPRNCRDPGLKFLLTDWETDPGFGLGAQIAGMAGMLALAINQKRILVTNYFNRADHEGCAGRDRSHWSCYFLPETSQECRRQALDLAKQEKAWAEGTITSKGNYTTKEIWVGKIPRLWGTPWETMQPTTEIDGKLLKHHRKGDRRWWRAQATRYLMRFKSKYTCELLNIARHRAFGMEAAKMVIQRLPPAWPKENVAVQSTTEIGRFVWSSRKPWIPRPLLSVHVRLGDKASEMKLVDFKGYMDLANQIRAYFPDVKSIWLSTEMQEVIDESKTYKGWNFYYTVVKRQVGNMTMPAYEASLGRETSTNYPLVNFLMAADADFFVGALGSTWCFLIDGMRSTGAKVMSGYLSVNKDRFW